MAFSVNQTAQKDPKSILQQAPEGPTHVRTARHTDIPHLGEVERSASQLFRLDPELTYLFGGSTLPTDLLDSLCRSGTIWVASPSELDLPVIGFLAARPMDGCFHIIEVSVHQQHQRRGIGKQLFQAAEMYARENCLPWVTLTTDLMVEWNMPSYARMGYTIVQPEEIGPSHVKKVEEERAGGLIMARRCVMQKRIEDKSKQLKDLTCSSPYHSAC